ncbi:hypothetical protein HN51_069717 [Arachis hypogaea]
MPLLLPSTSFYNLVSPSLSLLIVQHNTLLSLQKKSCGCGGTDWREKPMDSLCSQFQGKLNILINNVGTNIRKPMRELTTSELSRLMGYICVNKEENMCRASSSPFQVLNRFRVTTLPPFSLYCKSEEVSGVLLLYL